MQAKKINLKGIIDRLDTKHVGVSIASFRAQVEQVFFEMMPMTFRLPKRPWTRIVFCGMGGSALGADFIRSVYEPWLTAPIAIVNGYHIPAFADKNTLVVVCSYSGGTEEALSCYAEARKRKLPVFVITAGGALGRRVTATKTPSYIFEPKNNLSGQPRIGTGYTMTALYVLLKKVGVLRGSYKHLSLAIRKASVDAGAAAEFARENIGNSYIIIASGFMQGNAHILSNQMNETAKVFAPYFLLPELNHHLLEGLGSLKKAQRQWTVVCIDSSEYDPQIRKRVAITKKVMAKQGFAVRTIVFPGSRVVQALKLLSWGSWVSYYQGLLLGFNPSHIPWVDYFKKQL